MLEINGKENFNNFIFGKSICFVDFYATWCAPCRLLAPKLSAWAEKYKISGAKLDVSNNMDVSSDHNINLLPTIVFFRNGKRDKVLIGVFDESEFKKAIE